MNSDQKADIAAFERELQANRERIDARRQEVFRQTGRWISPGRAKWLRSPAASMLRRHSA